VKDSGRAVLITKCVGAPSVAAPGFPVISAVGHEKNRLYQIIDFVGLTLRIPVTPHPPAAEFLVDFRFPPGCRRPSRGACASVGLRRSAYKTRFAEGRQANSLKFALARPRFFAAHGSILINRCQQAPR